MERGRGCETCFDKIQGLRLRLQRRRSYTLSGEDPGSFIPSLSILSSVPRPLKGTVGWGIRDERL